MIEFLLGSAVSAAGLDWDVTSAGVRAVPGGPMHRHAQSVLGSRNLDVTGWQSRRLSRVMVERADLILTAATDHRRVVAQLDSRASRRAFTLLQFARILQAAGPAIPLAHAERSPQILEAIARGQALVQPVPPELHSLADPIGRPVRAFRHCADLIEDAVSSIVAHLS